MTEQCILDLKECKRRVIRNGNYVTFFKHVHLCQEEENRGQCWIWNEKRVEMIMCAGGRVRRSEIISIHNQAEKAGAPSRWNK